MKRLVRTPRPAPVRRVAFMLSGSDIYCSETGVIVDLEPFGKVCNATVGKLDRACSGNHEHVEGEPGATAWTDRDDVGSITAYASPRKAG